MLDMAAEIMFLEKQTQKYMFFYSDSFAYMCSINKVHLFKITSL